MLKKYKPFSEQKQRVYNLLGEYLRNHFFDQDDGYYGCYSTFDVRGDVKELEREPVHYWDDDDVIDFYWHVFEKIMDDEIVKMRYYWDGDGTLQFIFEDGSMIANTDCKCDYNWYYSNKVVG